MTDVYGLKNYIINHPEYIELILEKSGFYKIKKRNGEYRAAISSNSNPTSVRVNIQTLSAICFSNNLKGDIITLVQSKLYTSFKDTVKWISNIVGYIDEDTQLEYTLPFGGYYKKIAKLKNEEAINLETYSDSILEQYSNIPNIMFFEDGIHPLVQIQHNIGYDSVTNRITVPWRNFNGEIIGIMGRLNKRKLEEWETKWLPLIPFPKSQTIYGFSENYNSIQEKKIVMIGESEKFTMQLKSKGLPVGLALGGSFLSEVQANNIKSLFPEIIIVALDEGLEEEHSREIAKQLKSNKFYKNRVCYIYDKNNLYLPKGSKLSPSDLDKKTLKMLVKNCSVWI